MPQNYDGMALHFKGLEMEDGTLPSEYLIDLGRFGMSLKSLFKDLYVHKNGLKRAPAGFKGTDFNITGMSTSSTVVGFTPVNLGPSDLTTADEACDIVTRHLSGIGINMSDSAPNSHRAWHSHFSMSDLPLFIAL